MRERRAVLDHDHVLALERRRVRHRDRRVRPDHDRLRVDRGDVRQDLIDRFRTRLRHLVDHHHVRAAKHRLARVIAQLVAGTQRVHDRDLEVRLVEREVVVAAVPQHHVGFRLRLLEDLCVVHARVDDRARSHVRLVLLTLLDRALVQIHVRHRGEALHRLRGKIAVGHRVTDRDHAALLVAQDADHATRGLALAAAGANRADADQRHLRLDHRLVGAHQLERGSRRHHARGHVHHVLVRDVRVGEDHFVDLLVANDLLHPRLVLYRDPFRVTAARHARRHLAPGNVRDLRGREGNDAVGRVVAQRDEVVVKVAPGGAQDQHALLAHDILLNVPRRYCGWSRRNTALAHDGLTRTVLIVAQDMVSP